MFVRRRTETDRAFVGGRGSADCLTVDPVCGSHNDEVHGMADMFTLLHTCRLCQEKVFLR